MATMTSIMPSTRHSLSTYLGLHICTKYSNRLHHVLMHTAHEQSTQQSNVHTMTLQHNAPVTGASEASRNTHGVAEASEATCDYLRHLLS